MSRPIEDYAMIGDQETAALVSRDGSIDWLCLPRFDSDACMAAILGDEEHGSWRIAPCDEVRATSRRYQTDTLVLETDLETAGGAVRLIDFMPNRDKTPFVVRIVAGLRGRVKMKSDMRLRFDYGALPPWCEVCEGGYVAQVGPDRVTLRTKVDLDVRDDGQTAQFEVGPGDRVSFVLSYGSSLGKDPDPIDPEAALEATQKYWRKWIGQFDDSKTHWPAQLRRSLITLKALVYRPSGGLVAAPTTSLPEAPGGDMNWDYRFCWLRDATFTVGAFLNAGFHEEAQAWRDWLLRAIAGEPAQMRILYRIDGARRIDDWSPDLPGYRYAKPVRVGNAASTQHQVDVFGEVLDCLNLARRGGLPVSPQERQAQLKIVQHLEKVWRSAGSGVWESRGEERQYTYSKAMVWAGFDRALKFLKSDQGSDDADPALIERLSKLKDRVHDMVCHEGWSEGLQTFTEYFGGHEIDASLLLLPAVGFLPADDPRIAATAETIRRELGEGGLIRRKKSKPGKPDEGAFIACACWMADLLSMQGRHDEAREQFERVLALCNDVGLISEEYDVPGGRLCGNFPQALTHLAIVNTGLGLSGPVLHRAGG